MKLANNNPMVSVCILTYNQQSTIAETIESVLKQDCPFEFEIIIGEDCSTDHTLKICQKYQTLYPHIIKLIASKSNLGIMRNFKQVTDQIRGKYFAGCGGDDYWHDPNKLNLQVQLMENNLNCGMVHSGCRLLNVSSKEIKDLILKDKSSNNSFESILTGTYGQIIASTACIRTSLFKKYVYLNDYIERGYMMEDLPMWLDISKYSDIGYIEKPLVTYRIFDESISQSKDNEKMLTFLKSRWKVQFDYALKYNVQESVLNGIKKNKNDICIDIAFHKDKFKESIFWIKNLEYKNLVIKWSTRNFVLLILIFINFKYKQAKRLKDFCHYSHIPIGKFKYTFAK